MKRIAILALMLAAAVGVLAATASAKGGPAPKATGGYGYTLADHSPGTERHVSFAAIQSKTDTCGTFWNVTGNTTFTILWPPTGSTQYNHDVQLTQTGEAVSGTGEYPAGGPYTQTWHITSGSVVGDTITLTWVYDTGGNAGYVKNLTGTIASDGSISGTWTDNVPSAYTRAGTWTAPSGTATSEATYCGKGTFYYHDSDGYWYFGVVKAVSVGDGTYGDDNQAWFAAQILVSDPRLDFENIPSESWVSVMVTDNGEPGIGNDYAGGNVMSEGDALWNVFYHVVPAADLSATINEGNIQVH